MTIREAANLLITKRNEYKDTVFDKDDFTDALDIAITALLMFPQLPSNYQQLLTTATPEDN